MLLGEVKIGIWSTSPTFDTPSGLPCMIMDVERSDGCLELESRKRRRIEQPQTSPKHCFFEPEGLQNGYEVENGGWSWPAGEQENGWMMQDFRSTAASQIQISRWNQTSEFEPILEHGPIFNQPQPWRDGNWRSAASGLSSQYEAQDQYSNTIVDGSVNETPATRQSNALARLSPSSASSSSLTTGHGLNTVVSSQTPGASIDGIEVDEPATLSPAEVQEIGMSRPHIIC